MSAVEGEQDWVVGGVDRVTKEAFVVEVEKEIRRPLYPFCIGTLDPERESLWISERPTTPFQMANTTRSIIP